MTDTRNMTEMLSFTTTLGKLHVYREGILQVDAPFGRTIYSVACRDVTGLSTSPGPMFTVDLTIMTTQGESPVFKMVKQDNFKKLQALFPHLQTEQFAATGSGAWWLTSAKSHVSVYTDHKAMQKEIEKAAQHGWTVVGQTGTDSHVNVGRTAIGVALTGGFSLLAGASRSKDKITVTFARR
jgi:hypothetical protein